ncbi:MAG: hypothetical protein JSW61_05500 [Candidatus Thorarchaeota archaeon]|nr:MAG: hypothetical protein JSW61_05500 [Candidatus Thorarchaeota archaeon]
MSVEIPDRNKIVRSSIITVTLMSIFLVLGLLFWAWSSPGITTPVTVLNDINETLVPIIEILLMFLFFVFATVTVVNFRLYLSKVRAGWTEIIGMLIVVLVVSWLMFGQWVGIFSTVFSFGFVVYLYLLQD